MMKRYTVGHLAAKAENSYEHQQQDPNHMDEIQDVETYFMEDADIAILAYGSVSSALNA